MPRFAAMKHPEWTGKIVRVRDDNGGTLARVLLDGQRYGRELVGRQLDKDNRPTVVRWFFFLESRELGIPKQWCEIEEG